MLPQAVVPVTVNVKGSIAATVGPEIIPVVKPIVVPGGTSPEREKVNDWPQGLVKKLLASKEYVGVLGASNGFGVIGIDVGAVQGKLIVNV